MLVVVLGELFCGRLKRQRWCIWVSPNSSHEFSSELVFDWACLFMWMLYVEECWWSGTILSSALVKRVWLEGLMVWFDLVGFACLNKTNTIGIVWWWVYMAVTLKSTSAPKYLVPAVNLEWSRKQYTKPWFEQRSKTKFTGLGRLRRGKPKFLVQVCFK